MTPQQKIKWAILLQAASWNGRDLGAVTADNVDDLYDELAAEGCSTHPDAMNEVRWSGEDTGLPCAVDHMITRHYEARSVAAQMPDGSWVGWTFFSGGGKFGDPAGLDWIYNAYDVTCTERPVTVIKREFQVVSTGNAATAAVK